ncbi:IclR family transcriptional regulator [Streptomyces sp. WI04-05B]|uniref:IclR family transcriptional regulator n=1 Tax=Streptomyces TaxID=1883 RepID=UPI0029BBE6E5|nr:MULTISPECIES: helix-turn-helix domain-containing protein [unclassified Streptomyces]MDX2547445.1 helix-turn-helix domain-containing protein [Streptomyces sp. WI04-05B]MDX2586296.1 helix-turn-helix domain-containing protein [Streptomyces sp. WI04-05A]MDX3748946.1 helix-turn-helix domain-containing protein [Streptomyces sp. AK08-02]
MNEPWGAPGTGTAAGTAALSVRQLDRPAESERGAAVYPPTVPDGGGRSVLEGAFGLLDAVERAGHAGLTRLAAECGLPKTTAYRLLEQLVDLGAVERSRTGYRMGSRMFRLGQAWQPYPGLRSAARGPARRLARATGAGVGVNVLSEGRTLVLDWTVCETDEALDPLLDGAVWPWSTAAGKVLVAGARSRLPLGPMPASWRRESAAIRDRGVAFDREELVAGACCAAVPLYGPGGALLASLSVVTDPAHSLERLVDVVQQTGRTISARLRAR